MSDIRITDQVADQIARSHEQAAASLEDAGRSLPPASTDGGEAAAILTRIIGKIVGDCADLATANRATANVMR